MQTLGTKEDLMWPLEQWPAMKFKDGLHIGSRGGHGLVRYTITEYDPNRKIEFQFNKPIGIRGIHKLEIAEVPQGTQITHTIESTISGRALLSWALFIRPFHDAVLEDAFDKVQRYFKEPHEASNWSFWVKGWRFIFKLMQ